ncbi:hypothetical protein V8E51_010411 [Hyaloscypha variabilis]|jgi:hypothetical protein
MYDFREKTVTPARVRGAGVEVERERGDILGIPKRAKANVPDGGEHSEVNVRDGGKQSGGSIPDGEEHSEVNVTDGGEQSEANVTKVVEQSKGRGGTNLNKQLPAIPSLSPVQWGQLTNIIKIVIVLETMEQTQEVAEYLDFSNDEMNEVNGLLAVESRRHQQYEQDANALTQVMQRFARGLITAAEQEGQMEVVYALNKQHLHEAAPSGYIVQPSDVQAAQSFVRARAPDVRSCEIIINGLARHVGLDYSYETINALVVDPLDEDDEDDAEDEQCHD